MPLHTYIDWIWETFPFLIKDRYWTADIVSALGGRGETAYFAATGYRERNHGFCTDTLDESDIMKADVLSSILHTDMGMFGRIHGKL